jgi:hypothetical protein
MAATALCCCSTSPLSHTWSASLAPRAAPVAELSGSCAPLVAPHAAALVGPLPVTIWVVRGGLAAWSPPPCVLPAARPGPVATGPCLPLGSCARTAIGDNPCAAACPCALGARWGRAGYGRPLCWQPDWLHHRDILGHGLGSPCHLCHCGQVQPGSTCQLEKGEDVQRDPTCQSRPTVGWRAPRSPRHLGRLRPCNPRPPPRFPPCLLTASAAPIACAGCRPGLLVPVGCKTLGLLVPSPPPTTKLFGSLFRPWGATLRPWSGSFTTRSFAAALSLRPRRTSKAAWSTGPAIWAVPAWCPAAARGGL